LNAHSKSPSAAKGLSEIAKPESKVANSCRRRQRKAPSEKMLIPVLAELNAAGVKDENITVIFGCGTHRAVKPEEAQELLGRRSAEAGENRQPLLLGSRHGLRWHHQNTRHQSSHKTEFLLKPTLRCCLAM